MARILGKNWKKADLAARMDVSQYGCLERSVLDDGPGRGVRVATLRTGAGLEAQLLIDRCLDLGRATFNGVPLGFRGFVGDVHPAFYNAAGLEWLRTFAGGLLATCGLSNVGSPNRDGSEDLGLHGRIGNVPATDVGVKTGWSGDAFRFSISGTMREGHLFGPKLVLRRTISSEFGANWIDIKDTITNEHWAESPLMLLYHFNIGFPIVAEGSRLLCNAKKTTPRDAEAEKGADRWHTFDAPQAGFSEQVFYHDLKGAADGTTRVALVTPDRQLGVALQFNKKELPRFIEWKMMGQGTYVVGLEPANCYVAGRAAEREAGTLEMLKPGEEKSVSLRISVLNGAAEVEKFEERKK